MVTCYLHILQDTYLLAFVEHMTIAATQMMSYIGTQLFMNIAAKLLGILMIIIGTSLSESHIIKLSFVLNLEMIGASRSKESETVTTWHWSLHNQAMRYGGRPDSTAV